jgi:putative ABC transport system permease protein
MLQDSRYALRTLLKTPGYTLVAVLALALGIGANAAIFSFVDVLLLRPLPYPHADRLFVPVSIHRARNLDRASISYADYEDWRRETDLFDAVAVFQPSSTTLTSDTGDAETVSTAIVSEDYFRLTEVLPLMGRGLGPADTAFDASSRVVVIASGLWQRRFGGDPAIVGQQVRVGGLPHTIVGVLPPRATYPEETQLFLPLVHRRFAPEDLQRRDNLIFLGLARLADGVTREQAEARMQAIAARLAQEDPAARQGWTNGLVPLREYIVDPPMRIALYALFGAVGAVLLIACANLANLTLVRGAGRAREMGVRLALGASRGRLVRQLAAESLLLGLFGGVLGLAAAWAAVPALASLVPPTAPFIEFVALDGRVLVVAAALTLVTVAGVGLLPAFTTSAVDPAGALRDGARGASHGRATSAVRNTLVVAEIAIAVVLLVSAGLLVRSLGRITSTAPGVDLDRVLAARIGVPGARYTPARRVEFFRTLSASLNEQAGVQAAAATSFVPAGGGGFGLGRVFLAEGAPEPPAGPDVPAMWTVITSDYFRVVGIPLVEGRTFDDRDASDSRPVIIVSESFAARMFPNGDASGRRVRSWRDENVYREIVGIVRDVPFDSLRDRNQSIVYVPHAQQGWGGMTVVVRAESGSPASLAPALRQVVRSLDPELALSNVGTLEVFARNSVAQERLSAVLMGALAALALGLAVLGVYGIMSYSVSLRRREMGLRLALGAAPRDLYRLVLRRGLLLTGVGLAIGLAGAVAASRALQGLLFEIDPFDPVAFAGMVIALGVTALVASIIPARRAARADPLVALRAD